MKTGYKVGDVMTRNPVVASPNDDLVKCAQIMRKHHVGAVLAIEGSKTLGIITESDIINKVIAENKDLKKAKIKDYMVTNVATIEPDRDIFEALSKMKDLNIRRLPVVYNGKTVGLLAMKDILKIEPHLFEMLVDKIELREEERKPIHRKSHKEGMCNLCGDYTTELEEKDGVMACHTCVKEA